MSRIVAIALGSNLSSETGDREAHLREAVKRMGALGRVLAISTFRDTAPVEVVDQPRFLNGTLLLETKMGATALLRAMLAIEQAMGRVREGAVAKGPRVIDLDLLLYDDLVATTAELTVPHPAMAEREFVLEPLAEIAPGMLHPVLGKTIAQMLRDLRGAGR